MFVDNRSVFNVKHQPQNTIRNEAVEVIDLEHVNLDHIRCTRQLAEASGVIRSPIICILKGNKFHPHINKLITELNVDASYRRLHFCEQLTHALN